MSDRERLARDIRQALGELNDDAEPVVLLVSGLSVRVKELGAELAAARAGWQETIAIMASQERPAYDEQQQRIAKLEEINLGLTKTLEDMNSEKVKLVEALKTIKRVAEHPPRDKAILGIAESALAAHRKQEWEGGLPPVGAECEIRYLGKYSNNWMPFRVTAITNDFVVGYIKNDRESAVNHKDPYVEFRPLKTKQETRHDNQ